MASLRPTWHISQRPFVLPRIVEKWKPREISANLKRSREWRNAVKKPRVSSIWFSPSNPNQKETKTGFNSKSLCKEAINRSSSHFWRKIPPKFFRTDLFQFVQFQNFFLHSWSLLLLLIIYLLSIIPRHKHRVVLLHLKGARDLCGFRGLLRFGSQFILELLLLKVFCTLITTPWFIFERWSRPMICLRLKSKTQDLDFFLLCRKGVVIFKNLGLAEIVTFVCFIFDIALLLCLIFKG